jgi:hypothetical protein
LRGVDLWLFYVAVSISDYIARIWKEQVVVYLGPTRHLPGGTEKSHEKLIRIVGVPAEITTYHPPNTSLEIYRYTILLGAFQLQILVYVGIRSCGNATSQLAVPSEPYSLFDGDAYAKVGFWDTVRR